MNQSVVLKVTFKKETRRVPVNPTTWNVVEDNLREVFDNLADRIGLTYYDDENDLITVSSDAELIEAFRLLDAKKVSSYKFNLVELKEAKQEISEEEREKKLEEKLKKIQDKKQRKEEKAKAIQAKKEEREKQREEKKALKKKEKEQKLKEKEEKKEKRVSFSDLLHEIKSNQIELKQVEIQPAKVFPDAPVVAQWKATVPEPEDDEEEFYEEETIDISGGPDCVDLEDFIEVNETPAPAPAPAPTSVPIPPAKTEVPVEIPKEKEPKKEVDLLELQLAQLAEMGFVDRERNVELLLMNNMEMTEVVKSLLGM